MPTDDERRDVARSMRETAKGKFDFCAHNIALEIGMDDPSDFDECFDGEHLEAWGRLADLIEPNSDNIRTVSGNIGTASGIDRDALLALADECDSVHMHTVARRIREACGEAGHA